MNDVMNELKQIRIEINVIKEKMVDTDYILTFGEEKRLNDALGELKSGETFSLGDVERERRENV